MNQSGQYKVYPNGGDPFYVFCDMEADGGGWTVSELILIHAQDIIFMLLIIIIKVTIKIMIMIAIAIIISIIIIMIITIIVIFIIMNIIRTPQNKFGFCK